MWIPFKSSSCGREESKLLSWVERYQGVSPWQTQRLEWKWERWSGVGLEAHIQEGNTHEPRGRRLEFNQWVCKTGKQQPHTDISKRASLAWAGGSRRAAVKAKWGRMWVWFIRSSRATKHSGHSSVSVCVSVCFKNSPPANIIKYQIIETSECCQQILKLSLNR